MESVVESVFIHPMAEISPDAFIGAGTSLWNQVQVCAGTRVGAVCNIGKDVYIDANRIRLRRLPGTLTVGRCVGTSTASWDEAGQVYSLKSGEVGRCVGTSTASWGIET